MTKWEVRQGTMGQDYYDKGQCPNGDGGTLKRGRCQVCSRLWKPVPAADEKIILKK